jgi:DNA gyrase subunit A
MRVVIILKRDGDSRVVENQLFKHTQMQVTFGIIMLSLVNNRPEVLSLHEMLQHWLNHREAVVVRRTKFDLRKAEERAHILEGLRIALDHIDEVVALIRASKDTEAARNGLMATFKLSEIQASAILEMRLQRLVGLERQKVEDEYQELLKLIAELKAILADRARVLGVIRTEIMEIREAYGDERKTEIVDAGPADFNVEDLIAEEDMVITISHAGYVKRIALDAYRSQKRGGRGVTGIKMRDEDFVEHIFIASTHSYILFFTDLGRCHWVKVHEIPEAGRAARGKAIVNLLGLQDGERVSGRLKVAEFREDQYLVLATKRGVIKKTVLSDYGRPRRGGIIAVNLRDGDALIAAAITNGDQEIVLAKKNGRSIRFHEKTVRPMGRSATGVKGTTLVGDDEVVGMVEVVAGASILSVTENGYGKRSPLEEYTVKGRGGIGVINIKTTERNGKVVTIQEVKDNDQMMIITKNGIVIRCPISGISVIGRNTQCVRFINLEDNDRVVDVAHLAVEDEDEA